MIGRSILFTLLVIVSIWGNAADNNPKENTVIASSAVRNSNSFEFNKITGSKQVIEEKNFSEDFNLPVLRTNWTTKCDESNWSLRERPGYLRLKAQVIENKGEINLTNTFAQKISSNTNGDALCYIDLENLQEGDETGIYFSNKALNFIEVIVCNGVKRIQSHINNKTVEGPIVTENGIMLRASIKSSKMHFEYSTDGSNFVKLGNEFKVSLLTEKEDLIGLFCMNQHSDCGSVDIDWFYFKHKHDINLQFADLLEDELINEL